MVFERKIYNKLLEWKSISNGSSAILVEGARRIGKSTIVEEFARNEYRDYILIDFSIEGDEIRDNFKQNISNLNVFYRNLFLEKGKELPERNAVIIFDEVQFFPFARQSIKQLVKDGRYDFIETGSLISIKRNVRDILIPSEEEKIKMYPMDFEEYLWAQGDRVTAKIIRENFDARKPLGESAHRKIMQKYREYMAVGGMPQAVESFVKGDSYEKIDYVKRNIISLYKDDLKKNDEENREKASVIFSTIPEQLQNHNSHFRFSKVDKNARYRDYMDSVSFIDESMIGNECINVTEPEVDFEAFADRSNFKLYMGDTGLLVTQMMSNRDDTDEDIYKALIFNKLSLNQGMIAENAVAQALVARGYNLYFHEFLYKTGDNDKEKKYEIDFLIVKKKKICPIEVKSSSYKTHKSFDNLKKKYQIKMEDSYVIYSKDYKFESGIHYIPLYMTICL